MATIAWPGECGHFGPWAQLICRILVGGCSAVSRVSRLMFMVKVGVRNEYHEGQRYALPKLLW